MPKEIPFDGAIVTIQTKKEGEWLKKNCEENNYIISSIGDHGPGLMIEYRPRKKEEEKTLDIPMDRLR